MKNLIIIGAGGMGREIFDLATICIGYNTEYVIKGFIDDYSTEQYYIFVCSIGDVVQKKKSIQLILDKGGEFISLIHPDASIGRNSIIGKGCIILKNAYIGAECIIGDYASIQISAVIGHDVKVGKYSRVDCLVVCVGGTELKEEVTVHTSSVINHKVIVERNAQVGACSFVIRRVKENTTVFGNPETQIH